MPPLVPNIWLLQSRGDVDGLINALRHPDPGTRRGAAAALRALGAWQATPALQAALAIEGDWQAHAAIAAALQYLDHDIHIELLIKNKDVRGLSKMLNSTRHEDIVTACQALEAIGDKQAVEPLIMIFRNTSLPNKVRLTAGEALLKLEGAPAVVTLLGALRRNDWQVRRNAATVLGQLQAVWATEPLIKALEDMNYEVRKAAAEALKRIGTPEAIAAVTIFEGKLARLEENAQDAPPSRVPQPIKELAARLPTPPVLQPPTDKLEPLPESAPITPQVKKRQTGKLPPLPEAQPAETPQEPTVKRLAATGKLPPLPEYPPTATGTTATTDPRDQNGRPDESGKDQPAQ